MDCGWSAESGRAISIIESREVCGGNESASTADAIKCLTVCKKDRGAQSPTKMTLPCASRRMRPSRGTAVSSGCSSLLTVGDSDAPMAATPIWLCRRGVELVFACSWLLKVSVDSLLKFLRPGRTGALSLQFFQTYVLEGVDPFGVCPADRTPRTFGAVKLHVSARPLRWQYAHGCSPLHFTFRFLQRSHAAMTRSTRRRFS